MFFPLELGYFVLRASPICGIVFMRELVIPPTVVFEL